MKKAKWQGSRSVSWLVLLILLAAGLLLSSFVFVNASTSYNASLNITKTANETAGNPPLSPLGNGGGDPVVTVNATQDTYIKQDKVDENHGDEPDLMTKTDTGNVKRSLILFNLSSIPYNAYIFNANLQITVGTAKSQTVNIYRLTHNWTEGNNTANSGATWNKYDGVTNWGTSGGDYDSSTVHGSFSPASTGLKEVTITELVQGWVNGTWANYGILLDPIGTTEKDAKYRSRTYSVVNDRPKLVVSYQLWADLAVSKTDAPDPVVVGENLTYTVTVTNNGPFDTEKVNLTDTLPANVSFVNATPSPSGGSYPTYWWVLGNLSAGNATAITINVTVDSNTTGSISNTANVKSESLEDLHLANNNVTEQTTVRYGADLSIVKSDDPDPVVVGENLTYTLNVTNNGPFAALNVNVTDTLPAGVQFNSANPNPSGGSYPTYWWDLGTMTAGNSTIITINVTVDSNTTGPISNTANVTSDTIDSNTANNNVTEQTAVGYGADLSIVKSDDPDPVVVGENLNYTLTVTNNGPFAALNVNVTDTLPAGVQFNSANPNPSGGSYPTYWWDLGTMTAGNSTIITINVTVDSNTTGPISNTAHVSSETIDPMPGNNTDTEHTIVDTGATLTIKKVDSHDPVQNGTRLNYTIWVNNTGTGVATNVTVRETYDANVTFISADPAPSSGNNTWNFSVINASDSKRINITVNTSQSLTISTTLTNFVNVTCDQNVSANATEYTMIDVPATYKIQFIWQNATSLPDTRGGIYVTDYYIWIADHKSGLWRSTKCDDVDARDVNGSDDDLWDIYHSGNYIYGVGADKGVDGLWIYNDSTGALVGKNTSTSKGYGIYVKDDYAYTATVAGIGVWNVSDPTNPKYVRNLNNTQGFVAVKGRDNYIYANDYTNDVMHIYNISNRSFPVHVATENFTTQGWTGGSIIRRLFVADDDYVYVVNDQGDLYIVNVSNPSSPDDVGSIKLPGGPSAMPGGGVFVRGDDAFFCTANGNDQGYLYWVDVSNRSNPTFVDSLYDANYGFNEPYVEGCYLLVASHDGYKVYYATGWQPDGWISNTNESNYIGNHIYNDNGTNQTKKQVIPRGETAIFSIKVQNDAPEPQAILVQGDAASAGWTFTYYDSAMKDITAEVVAGTYSTGVLDPLQAITITLHMASDSNPGNDTANSSITLTGTACEGSDCVPLNVDVVIAQAWNHGLSITKEANTSGPVTVGEIIEYTINVTNTGDVNITDVVVHDSLTDDHPVGVLNVSETKTVSPKPKYIVTPDDVCQGWINNTANATGNASGDNITTATVYWNISTTYNASLNISKSANLTSVSVGDLIEYTLNVTNTGNVNLSNVIVHDSLSGDLLIGLLNVSETKTVVPNYVVTQDDVCAGWLNNSANATATDYCGVNLSSNFAFANLSTTYNASLNISKSANLTSVSVGDLIEYTLNVTNTGDVNISNVNVHDSLTGDHFVGLLNVSETKTVSPKPTHIVTQDDACAGWVNNSANVTGTDFCGDTVFAEAFENVTTLYPPPGLHVTKNPKWQWLWCKPNHTATFTINATADGTIYTERKVIDTMPDGMQFVTSIPPPDEQVGNLLIWNITDTYKNITLVVNFPGITFGRFKNIVEVQGKNKTTSMVDTDRDHAYASVSDILDPVWATKSSKYQICDPGNIVHFNITNVVLTNMSTLYIILKDTLPKELDYINATCIDGTPISPEVYYNPVTGETVLTWNHTAGMDFTQGEVVEWNYIVIARLNETLPPCTTLIERLDGYSYAATYIMAEDHYEAIVDTPCPQPIPVPAMTPLGTIVLVLVLSAIVTIDLLRNNKPRTN